jgi:prevent-host-death family protein
MEVWQLQEAKAKFSELIRKVQQSPIAISVHGEEEAIILSKKEFEKLSQPKLSLGAFLDQSPLKGLDIEITRDTSLPRDVDL